jgi:hypothetical protein
VDIKYKILNFLKINVYLMGKPMPRELLHWSHGAKEGNENASYAVQFGR